MDESTECVAAGAVIGVDAGGWGLSWTVDGDGRLRQLGVGLHGHRATLDTSPGLYPPAFPTGDGSDPFRPPPLQVQHADGTLSTRLTAREIRRSRVERHGEHVVVVCVDEELEFTVEHHLRTDPDSAVLEQWVEIHHAEEGPVTLLAYDSVAPFMLVPSDAEVVQFGGSGWADEWRWSTDRLAVGTTVLGSLGGVQPHLQRSPCLLVSPAGPFARVDLTAQDEQDAQAVGEVIGFSVAWGGNTHLSLDVRPKAEEGAPRELRIRAGAHALGAPYRLDPGERFVTPTVAWTWSAAGRDGVSDAFHRWTRNRVVRDPDRVRPIVVNNWEATYFDFDEHRIVSLIGRAAELGADVFLLDDGWFGTTRPRDDDTQGLGDWDPDRTKLPDGLAPLAAAAQAGGIRFGIWVEPEMANPASDLHDAHPDWMLRDRREPRLHRNQLVLDPLLAGVRDFEVDVVDRTLASAPGTTYVKWDANRPITDPGSRALGADRQANVWVDHVRATWEVFERVATAHPDVEMMLCASGGGRVDHGSLRWFHEFWTSDNTDPVPRVRMQWACSHLFPASVMAAHVTRWGGRPMPFACAVALSGRFGIDLDLDSLSRSDEAVLRRAVELARRTQDVVQHGRVRRYLSPVEGRDRTRAAWSVERDGRIVLFGYQMEEPVSSAPTIRLRGVDPDATYEVVETDLDRVEQTRTVDGAELSGGLLWPLDSPLTARIWELRPLHP